MTADRTIFEAMKGELQRVHQLQSAPLGLTLDAAIPRVGAFGSPLGNVVAAALLEAVPGADVAAINNAARGLRADVAEGPVTFGRLYDVFPFDNRIAQIKLTGADLGQWVAGEIRQGRRGWLGVSGFDVRPSCDADGLHVDLFRAGRRIHDDERLLAVTVGGPTLSGSLASSAPVAGVGPIGNAPIVREVVEDWFRRLAHAAPGELDRALHRSTDVPPAPDVDCRPR